MPRLTFSTVVDAPREAVWAWYDDVLTLPRITPPTTRVRLLTPPEPMRPGVRYLLEVRQPPVPIPLRWETIIVEHRPPEVFVDEQGKVGPFAHWRHEHQFEAMPDGRTLLRDTVIYDPPLGILGRIADALFIKRQLTAMFAYRHQKTREAFTVRPVPQLE
jgi:hypothetical protein